MDQRFKNILSIGEECTTQEELLNLLKSSKTPIVYDGFEPSGKIHIAQGLLRAHNVNKLTQNGCKFIFWIADWFAQLNLKFGGDLKKIQTAGKLMIETWKACGMDMNNVEFKWSSNEILNNGEEYWKIVFDIATKNSLDRVLRCTQIMGRSDSDKLMASQIFYPIMQCADIFYLKADICSLGMDQRKVNMMAREYSSTKKNKFHPIILSHHMILGLNGLKMSKSDPENAIFMTDTDIDVKRKIKKAYCPIGGLNYEQICDYIEDLYNKNNNIFGKDQIELYNGLLDGDYTLDDIGYEIVINKNPLIEYIKYIIFEINKSITIVKNNENINYDNLDNLLNDYYNNLIHPSDLKNSVSIEINKLLEPIRLYFKSNKEANDLLNIVSKYK